MSIAPWVRAALWVLAALSVAETFYLASREAAGTFAFPLDDAYIYMRYAVSMFELGPYRLDPSQPFSSGATSLAYPWLCGLIHVFGVEGQKLAEWVFWLSAVSLGVCAHLAFGLARDLVDHGLEPGEPYWAGDAVPARWTPRVAVRVVGGGSLAGGLTGLLAGVVVLETAHVIWGVLVGMEGGLYGAVLLGSLLVWTRGVTVGRRASPSRLARKLRLDGVPGRRAWDRLLLVGLVGLLPLCRPEGAAVAFVLVFLSLAAAPSGRRLRAAGWWSAALLPWLVAVLVHMAVLGRLAPNTAVAKSIGYEPYSDFGRKWELSKHILEDLFERLRGDERFRAHLLIWPAMSVGLALIGYGVGIAHLAGPFVRGARRKLAQKIDGLFGKKPSDGGRDPNPSAPVETIAEKISGMSSPWGALALASGAIVVGLSQNRVLHFDHHRYLIGLLLLVIVSSAAVFGSLARRFRVVWLLAVAILLASGAGDGGVERIRKLYAKSAGDIAAFQVPIGTHIRSRLPHDALVAVNDAGAIPYFSNRRTIDLVGLTTNGFARDFRNGNGSLFERLERMPGSLRPTHFAVFPRYLRSTGLIKRAVLKPRARRKTGSRANANHLYRARWEPALTGHGIPHPVASLVADGRAEIIDRVDVADLESEQAHDYRNPRPDLPWNAWRIHYSLVRHERRSKTSSRPGGGEVTDGGRPIKEMEEMRVKPCQRSQAEPRRGSARCLWVARVAAYRDVNLTVSLCGRKVGDVSLPRTRRFRLVQLELPRVDRSSCMLEIQCGDCHDNGVEEDPKRPDPDYVTYHHWIVSLGPGT
jgi:hypothetical protein